MSEIINFISIYIAPIGILFSLTINFLLFRGLFHRFRTKFHKLEYIKLKLEVKKLQRDLGIKDVHIGDIKLDIPYTSPNINKDTPFAKTFNKIRYRGVQGLKYVVAFFGVMMAIATLVSFGTLEEHSKVQIPISLLLLVVLIYGLYVYIDEWLKHKTNEI